MERARLKAIDGGLSVDHRILAGEARGDFDGLYPLRRRIEPELAAAACTHLSPESLDWLESQIALFTSTSTSMKRSQRVHRAFHTNLLRPAATVWDLQVLIPMWHEVDHRLQTVATQLDTHLAELPGSELAYYILIDAFRSGDPDAARGAMRHHIQRSEEGFDRLTRAAGGAVSLTVVPADLD